MKKPLKMENHIGDINHSKIDKIEQKINNYFDKINISSDLPEDFKEAFLIWLELSRKDLEWKAEQRARMEAQTKEIERIAHVQERAERSRLKQEFIHKSTGFHSKWIFSALLALSIVALFFIYLLPLYHTKIEPQLANSTGLQQISVWISWLPRDTTTQLIIFSSIMIYACFMIILTFLIAKKIAKKRAKRKFGNI